MGPHNDVLRYLPPYRDVSLYRPQKESRVPEQGDHTHISDASEPAEPRIDSTAIDLPLSRRKLHSRGQHHDDRNEQDERPLQPLTTTGDTSHPTGFFRDGYCWGAEQDPGRHFIGGVVTKEFLEFSKQRGNDLMTPHPPAFPGLKEGCRWCLCVERWKEALMASERLGERVVPKVDLRATAYDALKSVNLEDLQRFSTSRES